MFPALSCTEGIEKSRSGKTTPYSPQYRQAPAYQVSPSPKGRHSLKLDTLSGCISVNTEFS